MEEQGVLQRICCWGLWITTIMVLILTAVQGVSGNWTVFYLLWPGYNAGDTFLGIVVWLSVYHIKMGFAIGAISILIIIFVFLSKSNWYVRLFSVVGLAVTFSAAMGGYLFVTTGFEDRLSLGQMADSSIAVFAAYFLMLFFMNKVPRWPWLHAG
jgi:hypothetical protein